MARCEHHGRISRRHIYKDAKCKRCGKEQTWPKKLVERGERRKA